MSTCDNRWCVHPHHLAVRPKPVLYSGGRLHVADTHTTRRVSTPDASVDARRTDTLIYRPGVRRTDPNRVIGAKPAVFARWIFDLLGAMPGDEMHDVFPGSGGIARAWTIYTNQEAL